MHTKLLLDDLENLLLIEFLRQTLDGGQGFTSISLCSGTCVSMLARLGVRLRGDRRHS